MQSWGTQSRFGIRDAGREPSKSGVVGLLCAFLGRPRAEPLDDLAHAPNGRARGTGRGVLNMDYQTAGGGAFPGRRRYGVAKSSGAPAKTAVSQRFYLADADFLVGLESGDQCGLKRLHHALRSPVWQIYLGRKSFMPGVPVFVPDGLRTGESLERALTTYPWPRPDMDMPPASRWPDKLRMEIEDPNGFEVRMDQPVGASFLTRRFLSRGVVTDFPQSWRRR